VLRIAKPRKKTQREKTRQKLVEGNEELRMLILQRLTDSKIEISTTSLKKPTKKSRKEGDASEKKKLGGHPSGWGSERSFSSSFD